MLSVQENASAIARALRENAIRLKRLEAGAKPEEEELERVGREILGRLAARPMPSHWVADGDETPSLAETLDGFARLTKKLYFALADEGADEAGLISAEREAEVALEASRHSWWVNAFKAIAPSREMAVGLGKSAYEARAAAGGAPVFLSIVKS